MLVELKAPVEFQGSIIGDINRYFILAELARDHLVCIVASNVHFYVLIFPYSVISSRNIPLTLWPRIPSD